MQTNEGRHLPVPHCIRETDGWQFDKAVAAALSGRDYTPVEKVTFGSVDLPELIAERAQGEDFSVELVGLCTDSALSATHCCSRRIFPRRISSLTPPAARV